MQEPHIYRMQEAVLHYGEAIKAIVNEECGTLSITRAIESKVSIRNPDFWENCGD